MTTKEIQSDSLLSNISNISVQIQHNFNDGSGFFKNFLHENQNEKQIQIDALQDQQSFNHVSLLNQINFRNKQQLFSHQPQHTWVAGKEAKGLSQEDNSSDSQQLQKLPNYQIQKNQLKIQESIQSDSQQKKQKLYNDKKLKNQTKNIPKNYGKAIITFIEKYQDKVKYITKLNGIDYDEFINQIKNRKKTINTIADLRNMWVDYKYSKCMRLLSNLFLRKYALSYIFNSRICNFGSHIKYRYRLCQAIRQPFTFKHIKDY